MSQNPKIIMIKYLVNPFLQALNQTIEFNNSDFLNQTLPLNNTLMTFGKGENVMGAGSLTWIALSVFISLLLAGVNRASSPKPWQQQEEAVISVLNSFSLTL
jgi:hypothetical protein